jgi:hypothetical protein
MLQGGYGNAEYPLIRGHEPTDAAADCATASTNRSTAAQFVNS